MKANVADFNGDTGAHTFRAVHNDYAEKGYSVLPIHGKRPAEFIGGQSRGLKGWTRLAAVPADAATRERWAKMPAPGVGFVMGAAAGQDSDGAALVLIGIDDDRDGAGDGPDALGDAIRALLPVAPCKVGRKGCTWLARMRADDAVSADYTGPGGTVQLLAAGRQTVVPPSNHPDTGKPYTWTAPLVPSVELPVVRLADLDRVMQAHGYRRGAGRRESDPARYDAAAAEIDAGEVREGLIALIETDGGDLADLWERGADAAVMQRPTASGKERDYTGNGRRLELARQMRRANYNGAEFRAAAWEWDYTQGKYVVAERDLVRAWADSAPAVGTADGFGAVADDDAVLRKVAASDGDALIFLADEPLAAGADELFKGLVPWGDIGMFYGESGSGKSFLLMDFAKAVATGQDFMGFENVARERVGVLVIAAEAHGGLRRRRKALVASGMPADAPLITVELADHRRLGEAIRGGASKLAAMGADMRIVLIDTFGQFFSMKSENDNAEMGSLVRYVLGEARKHHVMIVPLHHPAQGGKEPRGASALKNALDWACMVEGGFDLETRRNRPRTVTLRKIKDGVAGVSFGFRIESVVIGKDAATGEDVTAGVAVWAADGAKTKPKISLLAGQLDIERMLREHGAGGKAEITKWMAAAGYGAKDTTVARHVDQLAEMGRLVKNGRTYSLAGAEPGTGFDIVSDEETTAGVAAGQFARLN